MAYEQIKFHQKMRDEGMLIVSRKYPDEYQKFISESSNMTTMKVEADKSVEKFMAVINHVSAAAPSHVSEESMTSEAALRTLPHLSEDEIQRIQNALGMKTFEMNIVKGEVSVTRGDKEFRPPMKLSSSAEIGKASDFQKASIVIESVIFVLEVMGVAIPHDEGVIKRVIPIVLDLLKKSDALIQDIDAINEGYKKDGLYGMAKGIFKLVINLSKEGIFWDITKALLSDMDWYDWIITSVKIAANIAALVATSGLAKIAKLVKNLVDATCFVRKLLNLTSFQAMKNQI